MPKIELTGQSVKEAMKRAKVKPLTIEEWQRAIRESQPDATEETIIYATAWAIMFGVVEAD